MFLLETARLFVRKFTLEDSEFLLELLNEPDYYKYIGDRNVRTVEDAKIYLNDKILSSYETNGFGLYLVETKDKLPVGTAGILKRDYLAHPDIGFAFLEKERKKGYALESCEAILHYALKELNLKTLYGITLQNNFRSQQLLTKLGFGHVESFVFEKEKNTLLYSFTRQ